MRRTILLNQFTLQDMLAIIILSRKRISMLRASRFRIKRIMEGGISNNLIPEEVKNTVKIHITWLWEKKEAKDSMELKLRTRTLEPQIHTSIKDLQKDKKLFKTTIWKKSLSSSFGIIKDYTWMKNSTNSRCSNSNNKISYSLILSNNSSILANNKRV